MHHFRARLANVSYFRDGFRDHTRLSEALGPVYEARSGDGSLVRTVGKARVPRIANVLRKPDD